MVNKLITTLLPVKRTEKPSNRALSHQGLSENCYSNSCWMLALELAYF